MTGHSVNRLNTHMGLGDLVNSVPPARAPDVSSAAMLGTYCPDCFSIWLQVSQCLPPRDSCMRFRRQRRETDHSFLETHNEKGR